MNTMNTIEQHTAIALALGYTFEDKAILYDGEEIKFRLWKSPNGGGMERHWPPNYPEDLNAMHEAEESLKEGNRYYDNLFQICTGRVLDYDMDIRLHEMVAMATAAQRAEAFLKTLNLWTPTQ